MLVALAKIACYALGGYSTYKTLSGRPNIGKRQRWASFWITLTTFEVIEPILDWTIFWIPFYYNIKLLFLLSLCYFRTKATTPVFRRAIHPVLSQKRKSIEYYERRIVTSVEVVHMRVLKVVRKVTSRLPQIKHHISDEPIIIEEEDAPVAEEFEIVDKEAAVELTASHIAIPENQGDTRQEQAEEKQQDAAEDTREHTLQQSESAEIPKSLYPVLDDSHITSGDTSGTATPTEHQTDDTSVEGESESLKLNNNPPIIDDAAKPPLPPMARIPTTKVSRSRSVVSRPTTQIGKPPDKGTRGASLSRSSSASRLAGLTERRAASSSKRIAGKGFDDEADVETGSELADSSVDTSEPEQMASPKGPRKVVRPTSVGRGRTTVSTLGKLSGETARRTTRSSAAAKKE